MEGIHGKSPQVIVVSLYSLVYDVDFVSLFWRVGDCHMGVVIHHGFPEGERHSHIRWNATRRRTRT